METENFSLSLIQNKKTETAESLQSLKKETRILLAGALFLGFPSKLEVKEFTKKYPGEVSGLRHCLHDAVCEGGHGKDYKVLSELNDFFWEVSDELFEEKFDRE